MPTHVIAFSVISEGGLNGTHMQFLCQILGKSALGYSSRPLVSLARWLPLTRFSFAIISLFSTF